MYDQDQQTIGSVPYEPEAAPPGPEWERDPDVVRTFPNWFRSVRGLLAIALIAFVVYQGYQGARGWFDSQLDPEGEPGETIELIVPSGATTADIGQILQQLEVIPNSTFFRYYARYKGEENFQAGEYQIQVNSSAQEAIDVLNAGPKPQVFDRFQVREGLWISEMLPIIADQLDGVTTQQLQAVLTTNRITPRYRPDGETSWEGLLFPDTYEVNAEASALEILLKLSDEFTEVTGELGYGAAETFTGYSAYEVLIVASLIEGETRVADERPLVASVIYNRLREGWNLGIDATCLYASGTRNVDDAINAGFFDQESESPYACRGRARGLPPTPINSPSRASLEAAISPAETRFMYYVLTDADGTHTFAETEEEFVAARQICVEKDLGCG